MTQQMNALFDQVYKVPQIPEVVRTLISQLNDPKLNMDQIAKNVTKDQVISMKVLRLVNSAHFGLSRKVSSIEDAVVIVGMQQLKTLIIASGIVSTIPNVEGFDVKAFWSDSFRTATYAKWIAKETGAGADMLFTAGLLKKLGKVLILMGEPKIAREIDEHVKAGKLRAKEEESRLGFTNAQVCAELCKRWKFPNELIQTLEQSQQPMSFDDVSQESCIVHVSNYLSACVRDNLSLEDIVEGLPEKALAQIQMPREQLIGKLPELLEIDSGLDALAA